jgi:hypothetical protein
VSQVSSIPQDVTAMSMGLKYVDSHSGRRCRPEDYSPKNGADSRPAVLWVQRLMGCAGLMSAFAAFAGP